MAAPENDGGSAAEAGSVEFRLSRRAPWDTIVAVGVSGLLIAGIALVGGRTEILPILLTVAVGYLGFAIYRLVEAKEDRSVQLRIDREGIWRPSFGTIPWSAIAELAFVHSRSGHYLRVELQDAEAHRFGAPAPLDPRRRRVVPINPLTCRPSDVRAAIVRHAPHLEP